ncbi:MAG: sodium:alanine symporter family protein [Lachnospiraceae bacterium]|nr:sodium:alanine symporter family protein [Lachnospiraceae bacterium]MCI9203831.1 sodium:alanine symporter family protein [Lachnospiraceae bacterium]
MQSVFPFMQSINQFLWSGPLLFLLMGTHLYFTMKLHFPQKNILKAIRLSVTPSGKKDGANLSVFATLSTTLAATLGTGNIIGVSTAIALGGPGAVFWCWITGILGMATAYAECFLSVRFRSMDKDGAYQGGPMYVWQNGLHKPSVGKFYGILTLIAAFGVGCTTQSNSITQTTSLSFGLNPHVAGFAAAILAGLVIVGGIRSIGNVCMKIVPFLGILYTASCVLLLVINREALVPAIRLILSHALAPRAALGGAAGSSLMLTARYGIARGLFTNEAGIGTAAIAAAASQTDDPARQAYVSMTAVFWDTVVMCLLSGLVIVSNLLLHPESARGVNEAGLTEAAFSYLPFLGNVFLSLCLVAFAITTLIGWSYLGEQAYRYVTGNKGIFIYKVAYIVMIYVGAVLPLNLVWECTDLINALMVIPNVAALFLLQRFLRYDLK